jgi:hypothetical protein
MRAPAAGLALFALSALLVACSGGDEGDQSGARTLNLMEEFVPGDSGFTREARLNVENISKHGEQRSHTRGRNCLTCHQSEGPGKGIFTLAGSLVDEKQRPYPNAILRLFQTAQAPGGGPVQFGGPVELADLALELELDENGNFFTTEELPSFFPSAPLYPQFLSQSGEPLFKADGKTHAVMGGGATVGGCNFCHGESFPIVGRDTPADDG